MAEGHVPRAGHRRRERDSGESRYVSGERYREMVRPAGIEPATLGLEVEIGARLIATTRDNPAKYLTGQQRRFAVIFTDSR
jgi:hypothetical protein